MGSVYSLSKSKSFLNLDDIEEFIRHIDTDLSTLKNEFTFIKSRR